MSNTQRMTGANLYVGFIDASGTVALTGDQRTLTIDWGVDTVDLAAASDSYHYNYATLKDATATLEVLYTGTNGTAAMNRTSPGSGGTLFWGIEGTATGKMKGGFDMVATKQSYDIPFDKAVMVKTEFKVRGGLVYNPTSATF